MRAATPSTVAVEKVLHGQLSVSSLSLTQPPELLLGVVDDGASHHHNFVYEYLDDIQLRLDLIEPIDAPLESLLQRIEAGRVECSLLDGAHERSCKLGTVGVAFGGETPQP
jgi:hypothetical protein